MANEHVCCLNCACIGRIGRFSVVPAANLTAPFHPGEPDGPAVRTQLPGPKSQQHLEELSRIQVRFIIED